MKRLDQPFDEKLQAIYELASMNQRWRGTGALQDRGSYWVTGVLAYFDSASQSTTPKDADQPIATRERLREYDPELFALVHETMLSGGHGLLEF